MGLCETCGLFKCLCEYRKENTSMTKIVNTTVEQVLKAAENGPQARKLLEELFPEAFKFQLGDMVRYRNPADQSNVYRVLDWSNLEAVLGALKTHKSYILILHENKNILYAADPLAMKRCEKVDL